MIGPTRLLALLLARNGTDVGNIPSGGASPSDSTESIRKEMLDLLSRNPAVDTDSNQDVVRNQFSTLLRE